MQVRKRIFAVNDFTFVCILAIFMDKLGSQSCTAQNYRNRNSSLVKYLQILLHKGGRFYQQATHRNTISFVLFVGINYVINGLFDSQINYSIAVV